MKELYPVFKKKKKAPTINPVLRHFLFSGIKRRPEVQLAEKHMGEIATISIIMTEKKTVMQVHAVEIEGEEPKEPVETSFSEEDKQRMLTTFKIKPQTIAESKHIFLMLDMKKKKIYITQSFKDGREPKDIKI